MKKRYALFIILSIWIWSLVGQTTSTTEISVFPNPARDVIHISGPATYEILDLLGNEILSGEVQNAKDEINVSTLINGTTYFVIVHYFDNGSPVKTAKKIQIKR